MLFDRSFIRETIKSFEVMTNLCVLVINFLLWQESVRELYLHSDKSPFAQEQSLIIKYDIGGTNFWPIECFDMVIQDRSSTKYLYVTF